MIAVPGETPVTMPDITPTVAIVPALVNQKPPDGVLLSAVVALTQTPNEPVMVVGYGLTDTVNTE
jgi:hypothetical protein